MEQRNDAYDYLPSEIRGRLPGLRATEGQADPVAQVKYFTPDSSWTWYALEFDPDEGVFFGLVQGLDEEFGSFTLAELRQARGPLGLPIERDLSFRPTPVSRLRWEAIEAVDVQAQQAAKDRTNDPEAPFREWDQNEVPVYAEADPELEAEQRSAPMTAPDPPISPLVRLRIEADALERLRARFDAEGDETIVGVLEGV